MTDKAENASFRRTRLVAALKRWGIFLGTAAAALIAALLPFVIRGRYFAWNDQLADGVTQHATFLEYMFRHGIFGGAGGYDYNIGLGSDYMVSFAYYMMFDPLNLLLYVLPRSNFLFSYSAIIFVRFLLAAVCMYVYLGKRGVREVPRIIFSAAYMLSGYMLYTFVRHPDLTSGAMYLPLVILGVEKAIDGRNPFVLVFSVFLVTVSSFYMIYMVSVYAVLYAALYYVHGVHMRGEKVTGKNFCKVFFRTAAFYALGLLLAAFVLLPVANGYLNASRSAGKGLAVYTPRDLLTFAGSFFAPVAGVKYTPVMFNVCAVMLAFAAVACSRRSVYSVMTIIFAAGIFVPLFGYVMNLFNYASNRFSYMLSFGAYVLLAEYCSAGYGERAQRRDVNAMIKGLCAAAGFAAVLAVWTGVSMLTDKVHKAVGSLIALAGVGATAAIVYGVYRLCKLDCFTDKARKLLTCKRMMAAFAAVTLCGAVVFNFVYAGQFDDGKAYAALSSPAEKYVSEHVDDDFVRLDMTLDSAQNRPLNNGYRGTMLYNTMMQGSMQEFLRANNVFTFSASHGMSGLNGRTALEALLACKYYTAGEGEYVPAQYDAANPVEEGLYRTENYIRFGTVFEKTMSLSQWRNLPEVERQYALLGAVVADGGEESDYAPVTQEFESSVSALELKEGDAVSVELPRELNEGTEAYVYFELVDFPASAVEFTTECGGFSLLTRVSARGAQMFTGQKEFLYKIDGKGDALTFRGVKGKSVRLQNIKFYAASYDDVLAAVADAGEKAHLTDTEFDSDGFGGKINSEGGTMLIPLPYSDGFTARIDGERVEIKKADGGLMCITVPAGEHEVAFEYSTKWLSAGKAVSIFAAVLLMALIAVYVSIAVKRKVKAVSKSK